jgi:hypothetical protein
MRGSGKGTERAECKNNPIHRQPSPAHRFSDIINEQS